MTTEDFIKSLEFMMTYGIITPQEYTEMYTKGIPYTT